MSAAEMKRGLAALQKSAVSKATTVAPEGFHTVREYSKVWERSYAQTAKLLRDAVADGLADETEVKTGGHWAKAYRFKSEPRSKGKKC